MWRIQHKPNIRAGYNNKDNTSIRTSYMTVPESRYEYAHTKYLRNLTKKKKGKSSRLKAEMRKSKLMRRSSSSRPRIVEDRGPY